MAIGANPGTSTLSGTVSVNAISGVATFSNLNLNKVGVGYTLVASSTTPTTLTSATSTTFSITPGTPSKVVITTQPASTVSTATMAAVVAQIQDAAGNLVTSSSASVTIAILNNAGGTGTLTGTTPVTASSGVATFSNLSIDKAGVGYTLTVGSSGLVSANSSPFNITAAGASKLAFSVQPVTTASAASIPAISVQLQDPSGNPVSTSGVVVGVAIGTNGGPGGVLSGTVSQSTNASGVASFAGLNINKAGTGYTLVASSNPLASVTSNAFDITPAAAAKVVISTQPVTSASAATITVAAQIQDAQNNVVTTSGTSVSIAIANNPSGGVLSGTSPRTTTSGVVTFNDLSINKVGSGYTLLVTAGSFTVTTNAFDITPGAANKLAFTTQPTSTASTAAINSPGGVVVQVQDAAGNLVTTSTAQVTITIAVGTGTGTLSGSVPTNAIGGVATFTALSIDKVGAAYQLSAAASSLASATSAAFPITPGAASKVVFVAQPGSAVSTVAISSVTVQLQDASSNNVSTASVPVTMAIGTNAGGTGVLSGTTPVNTNASGLATFSNLSIDKIGTGYTLAASSAGLAGATSNTFNITLGPAAKVVFSTQPSNTVSATAMSAVVVQILDAGNNVVTTSSSGVALTIANNAGPGGVLTGGGSTPAASGVATFSNLKIDKSGVGYTLLATSGAFTATSAAFTISAGTPSKVVFTTGPSNTVAGAAMTAVVAQIQDAQSNVVTTSAAPVTLAIGTNPGSGTLSGTNPVNAVNGVATFSDLSINKTGTGYTLTAASPTLAGATSGTFNITPGTATQLAFLAQPGNSTGGVAIPGAITVQVLDANGNQTTSTASVTVALTAAAGATLTGNKTVSAVAGLATFPTATLSVNLANSYTLTATSVPVLTSAQSASFTISVGPAAVLVFTQQPPATTVAGAAIGGGTPVALTATDAGGNTVSNTATYTISAGGVSITGAAVPAVAGVATFPALTITLAGAYSLTASATVGGVPITTGSASSAFSILPDVAAKLAFVAQPTAVAPTTSMSPSVTVQVVDQFGNSVASLNTAVTLTTASCGATTVSNGGPTNTNAAGLATFSALQLSAAVASCTLHAASTSPTLASTTDSSTFYVFGSATQVAFSVQPTNTNRGSGFTPNVAVQIQDANANRVMSSSASVTLTMTCSSGAESVANASLSATSGLATFTTLTVDNTQSNKVCHLIATSGALPTVNSSNFTLN
jgi:hypothetical protein